MISISDAILAINPNAEFRIFDEDTDKVEYIGNHSGSSPTKAQIETKMAELRVLEPKKLLREARNIKISESDWMANSDVTMSDDWKTYRQALRDLPATQNPTLDSNENLDNSSFTWPTEPS